jgi:hypothetical protein
MSCLTDEQIVSLALGEPGGSGREHLATCQVCADRLAEVLGRMDRLESALTAPDPAHAAGRTRLLAALGREPVPVSLLWRVAMNRRNWVVTAAAALLAAVVLPGWLVGLRANALAEALRPLKEAKSFACDMVNLKGGKPWDADLAAEKRGKLKTRLTWAAPDALLLDTTSDGKPLARLVVPAGKLGILIGYAEKEYAPMERRQAGKEEAVARLINTLAAYTPGGEKPAGTDDIDGLKAPRYDLAIADADKRQWHYRIWVDPETKRVLRVEFALLPGKEPTAEGFPGVRLERFEWDVKTEGLFDTTPPAGFKLSALKPGEAEDKMTQMIVAALRAYREAAGGCPKDEPFDATKAAAELEKLTKKKPDKETLQGFMLVTVLQSVGKEAVYHGKTIGPNDKDKVLFRWKLDSGQYRVILGDLRTETVSGEQLKELEGR